MNTKLVLTLLIISNFDLKQISTNPITSLQNNSTQLWLKQQKSFKPYPPPLPPPLKSFQVATSSNVNNQQNNINGQQQQQQQQKQENSSENSFDKFKRVCYFRMEPKTKLKSTMIDGNLCTHLILAFARINSNGDLIVARESDYEYLNEVKQLKQSYPHLKVLISVFNDAEFNGFQRLTATLTNNYNLHESNQNVSKIVTAAALEGEEEEEGVTKIQQISTTTAAAANELRLHFAKSAMEFLQHFNLDGIDLDWEFPNFPTTILNAREHERQGLTKICTSLRSAIVENFYSRQLAANQREQSNQIKFHHYNNSNSNSISNNIEPYLLTVAIAGQEAILRSSYELKQLANLCDWLNVMCYDYFLFKPYAPFTGPNAPLYPIVDNLFVPILSKLSVSWTISKLLSNELELPGEKLCIGIPTYARAYRLMFKQFQGPKVFTLALGTRRQSGSNGEAQLLDDYLNYNEVLQLLKRSDSVAEFDQRAQVPYMLTESGYTWISYENKLSVKAKVDYILKHNLGGYMTWNLNSDKFNIVDHNDDDDDDDRERQQQQQQQQDDDEQFPLHKEMLKTTLLYFNKQNKSK